MSIIKATIQIWKLSNYQSTFVPPQFHLNLTLVWSGHHKLFSDCLCARQWGWFLYSVWNKGQPQFTHQKCLVWKSRTIEMSPEYTRSCSKPEYVVLLALIFFQLHFLLWKKKRKKIIWFFLWEDFQVLPFKEQLKVNCGQYLKRVLHF